MADYETSIEIDATPADVFDYLVTEAGMAAWMGQHAALDPRPGGEFAVDIAGYAIRGRYLHVERPRRVVVSWGVAGSHDLPPGGSTVEFRLTPAARGGPDPRSAHWPSMPVLTTGPPDDEQGRYGQGYAGDSDCDPAPGTPRV